jgi:hypothetical protein
MQRSELRIKPVARKTFHTGRIHARAAERRQAEIVARIAAIAEREAAEDARWQQTLAEIRETAARVRPLLDGKAVG